MATFVPATHVAIVAPGSSLELSGNDQWVFGRDAESWPREGAVRRAEQTREDRRFWPLGIWHSVRYGESVERSRQMVARVTHVKVRPEDVEEAVRLFDDSVVPAAEQEEGFMGALLLTRGVVARWSSICATPSRHMRANEGSGFYQTQVAKFAGKFVDRPAREFYDVAVAKGVQGGPELLQQR